MSTRSLLPSFRGAPPAGERVRAVDWLRGVAVLVMIQCHALVLLRPELRQGELFGRLDWIDGLVSPIFLLSAGFSLGLVQVRSAQTGSILARLRGAVPRIGQVLAVAYALSWAWFPVVREPVWLLRLDILQCIGLSLLLAVVPAVVWADRPRQLCWLSALAGGAIFLLAPLAEGVEGFFSHFLNRSSGSPFPLFPWAGYTLLGVSAGSVAAVGGRARLSGWFLGLGLVGYALWRLHLPWTELFPAKDVWATGPTTHGLRLAWVSIGLALLLWLESRLPVRLCEAPPARAAATLGGASLSAYVFHLVLLYWPTSAYSLAGSLRGQCGWGLYALLTAALFGATLVALWAWAGLLRGGLSTPVGLKALGRRLLPVRSPRAA